MVNFNIGDTGTADLTRVVVIFDYITRLSLIGFDFD